MVEFTSTSNKLPRKIVIGSRPSRLALAQVQEVINLCNQPETEFMVKRYSTTGDKNKVTPISEIENTDFFTDTLETALLNHEIDFAVHSAKDLPDCIPAGLNIVTLTKSIDPDEVLVSRNGYKLTELPSGAVIGTSSTTRQEQLHRFRPDLHFFNLRGNIEERLNMLDTGYTVTGEKVAVDGIIVAAAGLVRLGLTHRITQRIPRDIITPHPLQGCLAIETTIEQGTSFPRFNEVDVRKKVLFIDNNFNLGLLAESIVNHWYWTKFRAYCVKIKNRPPTILPELNGFCITRKLGTPIFTEISDIKNYNFDYLITLAKKVDSLELNCLSVKQTFTWDITENYTKLDYNFFLELIVQKINKLLD